MMARTPARSSGPGRHHVVDRRKAVLFEGPSAIIPGIHTAASTAAQPPQVARCSRGILNSAFTSDEEEPVNQAVFASRDTDSKQRDLIRSREEQRDLTKSHEIQRNLSRSHEKQRDPTRAREPEVMYNQLHPVERTSHHLGEQQKCDVTYVGDNGRQLTVDDRTLPQSHESEEKDCGDELKAADREHVEEEQGTSALDLAREISEGHVPDSLTSSAAKSRDTDCKPKKSRGILKHTSTPRMVSNEEDCIRDGKDIQEVQPESTSPSTESRLQRMKPPHLFIRTDLQVPTRKLQRQMALDIEDSPASPIYNDVYNDARSYKHHDFTGYYNLRNSRDNEPVSSPFLVRFVDEMSYPANGNISERIEYVPNDAIWQTRHENHKQYVSSDMTGAERAQNEVKMLGNDRVQLDVSRTTFKKIARQLSSSGRRQEHYNVEMAGAEKPSNFFDLAVFTCFCCLSPLGLIAIITSAMTDIKYQDGDYVKSRQYSKASIGLSVAGIISTIIIAVVVIWTTTFHYIDDS